jgi:hypothetical protein
METETGAVDSPQQTELNLADVSTDDLREAMITQSSESPEVTEAISEEQSQEPGEVIQSEGETYEAEPEGETEEEQLAKRRIRPKNEMDQQVIDLYRSDGFGGTFADASRIIYGQEAQNQQAPQYAEPRAPAPEQRQDPLKAQAAGLQQEIANLEKQVHDAAEELDTTKALTLQREIMKKEMTIQSLVAKRERENERYQESKQAQERSKAEESRDTVYQAYPELADSNNVYRKEFDDFCNIAQRDPDFAHVFNSPRWPEIMANDFAARKGYTPQAANTAPPVNPQPQAPQLGTQAKVLTTGQTAQPANQAPTAKNILNNISDLSNDQIFEMLGSPDGRTFLR